MPYSEVTFRINTAGPSYTRTAYDISEVVNEVKKHLPLKRGWKHVVINTLIKKGGKVHRAAYIEVHNSKGVKQKNHGALVYSVKQTAPVQHRLVMSGETMVCSCGNSLFYDLGRSLFSYNFECSKCEKQVHPMTESGACQ